MITVENYNLYYNSDHLLSPKPKTYNEVLKRLKSLECKLFYNIISSPDCRYEKRFSKGRIKDHYKNLSAEDRFKNIFVEKILYANPKSFFVNKLNILPSDCEEIKSVSFTLSDYRDLQKHFEARNSEFGICFFHDFLQNKGLRPVEYLNENDNIKQRQLVLNSPHLLEVYSHIYDMRWENEWRINKDLLFSAEDIAFVIVPQDRYDFFLEWFSASEEFEDIQIITSSTFNSYTDHLIFHPQRGDNSWHQVEIFRDSNGNGLKISPEMFNDLTTQEKDIFTQENLEELECFSKNTILTNYEGAYTSKFIKFRNRIKNVNEMSSLFQDYETILDNRNEPDDADRDLIISLMGSSFQKYPFI